MSMQEREAARGVCAVMITFHPKPEVSKNLALLAAQVEHVVVVDNGSTADELAPLYAKQAELGFDLIENGENLGIGRALNLGIRRATKSKWVLLLDQDSRVTDGFMAMMRRCAALQPSSSKVGVFIPRYLDMRFGHTLPAIYAADGTVAVAMTSGSMMRRSLFEHAGLFVDWFIYEIDYEFSLRVRRLGYTIFECCDATLLHSPADPCPVTFFGKRLFYTRNYGAFTRYYMQRNAQWLRRIYGRDFPEYFSARRGVLWKEYVVVILGERNKWSKLRAMLRGYRDGLRTPIPTTYPTLNSPE